nr:hypothetical protein [Snodgrassella alvi]
MKKIASVFLLAASLSMTAGIAMANAENDDTDINNFTQSTAQNGQNTNHVYGNPSSGAPYHDLNGYRGDN